MDSDLNVALFASSFPNISETFILRQVSSLVQRGVALRVYPTVLHPFDAMHPELESIDPDVNIRSPYRPRFKGGLATVETTLTTFLHQPIFALRVIHGVSRDIEWSERERLRAQGVWRRLLPFGALGRLLGGRGVGEPADVLHAHFGDVGRIAAIMKRGLGWKAPLVVTFHGSDANVLGQKMPRHFYKPVFDEAAAITYGTPFLKQRLLDLGAPAEKLRFNPMGVGLEDFRFSERSLGTGECLKLLSVGRLIRAKGHETGLRAAAVLADRGIDFRYDIVGDGPLMSDLKALAKKLGLEQRVHFHGAQGGAAVRDFYLNAHVFLFPSCRAPDGTEDQQPVVMIEAQATGLPVVATNVGGVSFTMRDGESGLLVPSENPLAMADAVEFIVQNYKRIPFGQAGRAHVESVFSHERCMDGLLEIYRECLAANIERAGAPT